MVPEFGIVLRGGVTVQDQKISGTFEFGIYAPIVFSPQLRLIMQAWKPLTVFDNVGDRAQAMTARYGSAWRDLGGILHARLSGS